MAGGGIVEAIVYAGEASDTCWKLHAPPRDASARYRLTVLDKESGGFVGLHIHSPRPCPIMPGDQVFYGAGKLWWTSAEAMKRKPATRENGHDIEFARCGFDFQIKSREPVS